MGTLAHRVIGELLEQGNRRPTALDVVATVAASEVLKLRHVYRLAARQDLVCVTAIYFRMFVPDDTWAFVGAEVEIPHGSLDLVFEHCSGAVRADEPKTGGAPSLADQPELDDQVQREVCAGRFVMALAITVDCFVDLVVGGPPCESFSKSATAG